jgi:hypothetical protein
MQAASTVFTGAFLVFVVLWDDPKTFLLLTELRIVMRGLDPRIHLSKRMDCRVKPGNDDGE